MIDIPVNDVLKRAYGDGGRIDGKRRDAFVPRDTTSRESVDNVCHKVIELMQSFENLRVAIASCGDCVRFDVTANDRVSLVVTMAAVMDAISSERLIFIDSDDQMGVEDKLVRSLHQTYDTSAYVMRRMRRLRRPAR